MSDTRTPEQIQADDELEAAMIKVFEAYDWGEEFFLNTWIVVGHRVHQIEANVEDYFNLYPGGHQPHHVGLGLLYEGILHIGARGSDES